MQMYGIPSHQQDWGPVPKLSAVKINPMLLVSIKRNTLQTVQRGFLFHRNSCLGEIPIYMGSSYSGAASTSKRATSDSACAMAHRVRALWGHFVNMLGCSRDLLTARPIMWCYGIRSGLARSTDHRSRASRLKPAQLRLPQLQSIGCILVHLALKPREPNMA